MTGLNIDLRQQIQDDDYAFPYHYVPQFQPGYTHTYSWPWGLYYASAMEYVLGRVARLAPTSIVDVGTGDGRMVRELVLKMPTAAVSGVDYSPRAIQLAQALNPTLKFRCMDILEEEPEARAAVLTLIEVFEHIPPERAKEFVAGLRRMIDDQGHLVVTVPHANVKVSRKHFRHFTAPTLEEAFAEHFAVEEVVFLDRRDRRVTWLRKLLENDYFILTHWGIRNRLYALYKRRFLITDEGHCGRIFMIMRPR
jgi:SAM-dependent methyltransferase